MKIGFSFGRCIRDIVKGEVAYDDVAFIITGTALRDEEAIKYCVEEYMYRDEYLYNLNKDQCIDTALRLYKEGKVFQPRLQNIRAFQIPEGAVWADMFPTNMANNASAKTAWDNYRFLMHMTNVIPEDVQENWRK
jgi:hypothetical protein